MEILNEIEVSVRTPTEIIFSGKARSVSSENTQGKFDILPYHANFVTLIQDKPILVRIDDAVEKQFSFKNAVIHTNESFVNIYADVK